MKQYDIFMPVIGINSFIRVIRDTFWVPVRGAGENELWRSMCVRKCCGCCTVWVV